MDYQRIVDELRSFVLSIDQTLTDRMKEVAGLYVQACNEVNQRLRRCEEFLKKGLRSEAVHLAQTEPVLLDVLAILDFPERPQWEELALIYGLPAAPQLRMETALSLNEAYADEQPLEELLRKHRLLALSRGSLKARISIMRRIAELDSANPVWPDDIRHFEKHRFQELQHDLATLTRGQDYEGLAAISSELETSPWLMVPPPALVKQVDGAKNRFRQTWASGTLKSLEAELNEAINSHDLDKAKSLREKWNCVVKDAELPEGDPLLTRSALAFNWLAEQELNQANERAFQDSLDDLENALDNKAETGVVERAYHTVKQYEREIPPSLESRFRLRMDQEAGKRARKQRLLIGGIAAASLLFVAAIIGWAFQAVQTKKTDEAVASLEKMLEEDHLQDARAFLDNLSEKESRTAQQPEVLALKSKLVAQENKERERARQFQQALKEAEAESGDVLHSPALSRAESLAKKAREWDALEKIADKRRAFGQQAKLEAAGAFQARINDLAMQIQKLEDLPPSARASQTAKTLLNKLQIEVSRLGPESKQYNAELRNQADLLVSRLDATRLSIERSQLELDLESKLSAALLPPKGFENYVTAMEKYCNEFPKTRRAADFKTVLSEQALWKGVLEWSSNVSGWTNGPFNLEPEEARQQSEKCRQFLKAYSTFVAADLVAACVKSLDGQVQRDEKKQGSAAHDLQNLFEDFLIKNLWVVKMKDKKTYYLAHKPDFNSNMASVPFRFLLRFDGKEEGRTVIGEKVEFVGKSPQSELAADIRTFLPVGHSERIWVNRTLNISQKIANDKETDPILKLVLLKKSLDYAARGSYPLWLALTEQRNYLDKLDLKLDVAWMNPDDEEANTVRPQAVAALTKLPAFTSVSEKAVQAQEKIVRDVGESERVLLGWLARGDEGWECRFPAPVQSGDFVLQVLMRDQNTPMWKGIGTLKSRRFAITSESPSLILEGRLVFGRKI